MMPSLFFVRDSGFLCVSVFVSLSAACAVAQQSPSGGHGNATGSAGESGVGGKAASGGSTSATGGTGGRGNTAGAGLGGTGTSDAGPSNGGSTMGGGGSSGSGASGVNAGGATAGGAGSAGSGTGGTAAGGSNTGGTATGGSGTGGAVTAGSGGTGIDNCPSDPQKTQPGNCGCGFSEAGACITHRYSFTGTGTQVTDSAGALNGRVVNTTLQAGSVSLAGGTSDQYVSFAGGMLSRFDSVTIEAWVTWNAGAAWQRIFDFGNNDGAGAGSQGAQGITYLFLTPKAVNNSGHLRVAYSLTGSNAETRVEASAALPSGVMSHLAVVVNGSTHTLALYLNGMTIGSTALANPLSSLSDVNAWLGRSQFQVDPEFNGSFHEFRMYSSARTSAQILASFQAGPDAPPSN
jgi:Concanavalin A-like lectin/glucanases superfamily